MTAYEALQKRFELEVSQIALEERLEELEERIPELLYAARDAKEKAEARSGALERLLRRLSGKEEENRELLELEARKAAAALDAARRERKQLEAQRSALCSEQEALGDRLELKKQLTEAEQDHFLRLEAGLHAEKALHYLRKCRGELSAAQDKAQNPMMQVGDGRRLNEYTANAGALADQCRAQLETICGCGFDFPIHPYIQNPMGYLVTARDFGILDQLNGAQKGIRETEAALKELLLQLAE